jgi:hypothetical protein
MDSNSPPVNENIRPLILSSLLAVFAILTAMDLAYLTHIVGYLMLMIALGILAVINMTCNKVVFALNVLAFLTILFFTGNQTIEIALLGAVAVLSALMLSVAVGKKSAKTSAVLVVGITFSLGCAIVFALLHVANGNSLAPEDLFENLNGIFDSLKALMADIIRDSVNAFTDEMLANYAKFNVTKEMLLESALVAMEGLLDLIQLLLPGICVFLVQTLAYVAVSAFEKMARFVRCDIILPDVRWRLFPTQISCIVYIVVTAAYFLAGLFSAASAFSILMMNFWIALMPVMIACGFSGIMLRLKHPRLRKSMIFILVLFAAGCVFMTGYAIPFGIFMLTFMGAQDVSLARTAESLERRNKDLDGK